MSKISVRFFNDREVRAIWDEVNAKWWFSVLDIVGVLNAQNDYTKNRNYWKYLKNKLKKEESQLVSATNQLKMTAADGKRYLTDVLDNDGVVLLAKSFPNTRASRFVEWFTNSDETIDGKSKSKAYALFGSNLIDNIEVGTIKGLQQIHGYLFGGLYEFAGQIRTKTISKGGWVMRSSRYKRCTGNAPTWIDVNGDYSMRRSSSTLCVFEGFMDFLSWRMIEDGKQAECDCCVLNSVNNLGKIISKAMDYECVRCYMDNDEAGLKAFSQLAQVLEITDVSISDISGLYEGYNDLNEMLMNNRTHFNT